MFRSYALLFFVLISTVGSIEIVAENPAEDQQNGNIRRRRRLYDPRGLTRPRQLFFAVDNEDDVVQNEFGGIGLDTEWDRVLGGYYVAMSVDCIPVNGSSNKSSKSKSSKSLKGSSKKLSKNTYCKESKSRYDHS